MRRLLALPGLAVGLLPGAALRLFPLLFFLLLHSSLCLQDIIRDIKLILEGADKPFW